MGDQSWLRHSVFVRMLNEAHKVLAPPPDLTLSEWADENRRLSPEASAEPGRWDTSRAEYARGIMDAISDPLIPEVVVMSSAQVGKTELLLNAIGYFIDQDPAPILLLQPTLEMGEAFSKDRLAPMVRDSPCLVGKIKDSRQRDSGNTLLHKTFPGGHITIAGSNSPASLASRPIRVVLADEVDRYPVSAGTEGDPLSLARKRTTTFWNKKLVSVSTPTIKGYSRIELSFENSDQRHYHVPCPHCQTEQVLRWKNVKWASDSPEEAYYVCEHCNEPWTDAQRWRAIRGGRWIASKPFRGIAGFHLNEIYSSWVRLGEMAIGFLEAKRSPETLKTWVNTSLGETWEENSDRIDGNSLSSRAEDWGEEGRVPNGIMVMTAGVDVQGDRLEFERVGWGLDQESWSIEHDILYGDPSNRALWEELYGRLIEPVVREDDVEISLSAAAIDSGGHHTQMVYRFTAPLIQQRIYAIKGSSLPGRPIWPKRANKVGAGFNLYYLGTDSAKDMIYARFKLQTPGPGYCHFPKGRDPEYFNQLAAEGVRTRHVKGFPVREYYLPGGKRNEALDLRVYALAALYSLNIKWGEIRRALDRQKVQPVRGTALADRLMRRDDPEADEKPRVPIPPPRPKGRAGRRIRRSSWQTQ
jgi:phage terminase large subunit GpA-like protein